MQSGTLAKFESQASHVAALLKTLSNPHRLMVLCKLIALKSANVTQLGEAVGLSQSALSQHLSRLREEGLVTFEREAQTLWYRIADPRLAKLLATLYKLYCTQDSDDVPASRPRR